MKLFVISLLISCAAIAAWLSLSLTERCREVLPPLAPATVIGSANKQ
jgi:hypothetical protein